MDLSRSDWEYVGERGGAFVGREWVFAQVRGFLSGPPGTFLLRGDPGTGKTAVAARLAQASCGRLGAADPPVPPVGGGVISAAVFCRAGKATVAELAQRLSDQLAASVDGFADALRATAEPGITIRDVRVDVHGDVHAGGTVSGVVLPRQDGKQAFSTGVAVPLRHLRARGAAEPVVLLVDAVDEAADAGEVNVLSRLLATLDDVYLIVTCRPDPSVLSDFRAAAHKLDLIADAPADDDDVRRYIRNRLTGQGPEEAVDVLVGRVSGEADGNFLFAFYVTGTLIGSGSLAGMDEKTARGLRLPTGGLPGVYEDFLDRQIAGDVTRWARELRPVLAPLAVAQDEGFTSEQLRLVAGRLAGEPVTRTAIREVTRTVRQFLDGPAPDGPFRVYHQSFADFLADPAKNPDFLIDAAETHEAIVAAYAATDPLSWDDYARRNLALHASEAGQLDRLLEDARFLLAADPARLALHLDAARSAPARAAAAVYRQSLPDLTGLGPAMRASQLELYAHRLGHRDLAASLAAAAPDRPWRTHWSRRHGSLDHQTRDENKVLALTVGVLADGAPVVVSGGADGKLRVWRLADGSPVGKPITGHPGGVTAVATTAMPDAAPVVVSGGADGKLRVWRLADGSPVGKPITAHPGRVTAVATTAMPDATPVVITGGNQWLSAWRLADGAPVWGPIAQKGPIKHLEDHAGYLTGTEDLQANEWTPDHRTTFGMAAVEAIAMVDFPDGIHVVVSSGFRYLFMWRLADGGPAGTPIICDGGAVLALAVAGLPDGTPVVITGDYDGNTGARLLTDGAPLVHPLHIPGWVRCIAIHRDTVITAADADVAAHQLGVLQSDRDLAAAQAWYELAAVGNDPAAVINLGVLLIDQDPAAAQSWFERVSGSDPEAMFNVGMRLIDRDPAAAQSWFEKAAATGNTVAMKRHIALVANPEQARARSWFEAAGNDPEAMFYEQAAGNDPEAMFNVGMRLIDRDPAAALRWFERAAADGDSGAMVSLGMLLRDRDSAAARSWFERAAAAGNATAMNRLALLLLIDRDRAAARSWFERGAAAGDTEAMVSLAELLQERDPVAAQTWYERAAADGDTDAMFSLGALVFERDPSTAQDWWERAAEAGHVGAMFKLGELLLTRDPAAAQKWYERAEAALG
jgi:TPR repeat protein